MTVLLVAGPPCAGKTMFAHEAVGPSGIVVDWDEVMASITGLPLYEHPAEHTGLRHLVERNFRARAAHASRMAARRPRLKVAIVRTAAPPGHRTMLRRIYGARPIVLNVPSEEALRRLASSGRPAHVLKRHAASISSWWEAFRPTRHDTLLPEWTPGTVVPGLWPRIRTPREVS